MSRIIEANSERTGWRFVGPKRGIKLLFGSRTRPLCQAHIGGCGQAISIRGLMQVFQACAPEQEHGGCDKRHSAIKKYHQDGFISNELEVDFFNDLIPLALCLDHKEPNDVQFKRSCRSIRERWRSLIHAELQLTASDDDDDDDDDNTNDEADFDQRPTKKGGSDKFAALRNSSDKKSCKTPQRPQLPRRNDDFSLEFTKPKRSRRDSSCDYMTESPGSAMSDMSPEASPVFDSLSPSFVETPPTAVPTGRSSGAKEQESPTKRTLKIKRLARTGAESEWFLDERSDEDDSEDDTDSAKGSSDGEEFVEESGEDSLLVAGLSGDDGEESEEDASFVAESFEEEPSKIGPRIQPPVAPVITINVSMSEEEALSSDASSEQPSDVNSESDGNEHGSGRELVQKPAPRSLSRPGSTVSVKGRLIDLISDPSDSDEERTGGNSRRPRWRKVERPRTESRKRRSSGKQDLRSDESADDAPERGKLKDGHPRIAVQRLLFPPEGRKPASSILRSRSEDSKSIPQRSRPGLISQPRASSSATAPVQSHATLRKSRDEARDPPKQPATQCRPASSESRHGERDSSSKMGSWLDRVITDDDSDLELKGKTGRASSHNDAQHVRREPSTKRVQPLESSTAQIMQVFEARVAAHVQMATERLEQLIMGLSIKDSSPVKASTPEREPEPPRTEPPKRERATLCTYPDAMGPTQATPESRLRFKKYELPKSTRLAAELLAKMRDEDRRKPKRDGHGYVYGYIREDLPGFIKIGSSEPKDPEARMKTWKNECGVEPHLVFCLETDYAGTWAEGLMHIQLHQQRWKLLCPQCKKDHDEWFEMGASEAVEHAELWKRFINLDLYDPGTSHPVRSLGLWIQQQKIMIGEYSADGLRKTTPKKGEDEQHEDIDSVMESLKEFIEERHDQKAVAK